jgi:hypothetical protein
MTTLILGQAALLVGTGESTLSAPSMHGANITDATTKAVMELFSEWERRGAERKGLLKLLHSTRVTAILVICCVFWLLMFEFWSDMAIRLVMHIRTCHGSGKCAAARVE